MNKAEISSTCRDCCFEDNRMNCKIGKLDILSSNGAILLNDDSHTVINGRICNFKRDNLWFEQYKSNYLEQLNEEVKIKYGIIINSNNINNLESAVDFAENQYIKPDTYYVVYYNNDFDKQASNIQDILNKTNKRWFLKRPLESNNNEFNFINEYFSADIIQNPFILYIKDSNIPRNDLIQKINKIINDDLKQMMVCSDYDYIFTSTLLIKLFPLDQLHEAIIKGGHGDKIQRII